MNTKALETLTAPISDTYSQYVKLIASMCMARCPKYRRPREGTVWLMLTWRLTSDPEFQAFLTLRGIMGIAKFVATVIDVWGYWLNEK